MPTPAVQPAGAQPTTFSFSTLASRIPAYWLKLLLGGLGMMFVGWMIHTHVFLSLVNGVLLITGIVAVLIFIGTKNPAYLVGGTIALVVRFMQLLDWAVNAVWMWLIIVGLAEAIVGIAVGIVTDRRSFSRTASTTVLMAGICVSVVKRSAASGELTRVLVGVASTILAIMAAYGGAHRLGGMRSKGGNRSLVLCPMLSRGGSEQGRFLVLKAVFQKECAGTIPTTKMLIPAAGDNDG